jgi:hypothetical protein
MKVPVGRIPKYISAVSERSLQRIMLQTQIRLGYGVNWFDIKKNGKKWYAWYYDNNDINIHNIEEKIADTNS